jgi:hypothetical protein
LHRFAALPLDAVVASGKLPFFAMSTTPIIAKEAERQKPLETAVDAEREFDYPQREAAFFYGLFLRGHSADELRRDIQVPPHVLAKWHREAEREPGLRDVFERMVEYRRHVLAIFDSLLGYDARAARVQ